MPGLKIPRSGDVGFWGLGFMEDAGVCLNPKHPKHHRLGLLSFDGWSRSCVAPFLGTWDKEGLGLWVEVLGSGARVSETTRPLCRSCEKQDSSKYIGIYILYLAPLFMETPTSLGKSFFLVLCSRLMVLNGL